jgi:glutamyl-tRNA reductase
VELDRVSARLSEGERASLDLASRALVAKLLHEPTIRLKAAAGTARGERLADALRDLFDLD